MSVVGLILSALVLYGCFGTNWSSPALYKNALPIEMPGEDTRVNIGHFSTFSNEFPTSVNYLSELNAGHVVAKRSTREENVFKEADDILTLQKNMANFYKNYGKYVYVIGVGFNFLVAAVIFAFSHWRSTAYVLIFCVAVFEIVQGILALVFVGKTVSIESGRILQFVNDVAGFILIWTVVGLAINLYIMLYHPRKAQSSFTPKKAVLFNISLWVLSCIYTYLKMNQSPGDPQILQILYSKNATLIFLCLAPFCIDLILFIAVISKPASVITSFFQSESKTGRGIRISACLVVRSLLFNGLYIINYFLIEGPTYNAAVVQHLIICFGLFYYAFNPIIFICLSKKFRKSCKEFLSCRCSKTDEPMDLTPHGNDSTSMDSVSYDQYSMRSAPHRQ